MVEIKSKIVQFILQDRRFQRLLEIFPGFISWNMILFPIWASFFFPATVAFLVLAFNIIWFYRSFMMGLTSVSSYLKIEASKKYDILSDVKKLTNWEKVYHVYMNINVNEPGHVLEKSLEAIAGQDFPRERIIIVLAMEEREKGAQEKSAQLIEKLAEKNDKSWGLIHEFCNDNFD